MKEYSPWKTHLLRAEGYAELGMLEAAEKELKGMAPADRARPEVLGFQVGLYTVMEKWDLLAAAAGRLTELRPGNPIWWVQCAYGTRRCESVESAEEILLAGLALHPEEETIWYNLSCYACVLGRLDEARERLGRAISLDGGYRTLALEDEDLKAIWSWVAGMP